MRLRFLKFEETFFSNHHARHFSWPRMFKDAEELLTAEQIAADYTITELYAKEFSVE